MARECSFRANKQLLCIVGALPPPGVPVPHELEALLNAGISRQGELTMLAALEQRYFGIESVSLGPTGIECFVNHVHIDDYVPADDALCLFSTGWQMGLDLKERLPRDKGYVIILSLSPADYDDGLWVCSLRFHTLRAAEAWLHEDLESYVHEGIIRCVVGRTINMTSDET